MLDYSEASGNVCLAFNQHIGLKDKKFENLVHLTFNWIVFMPIVKHFRVKMRLTSFCCVNLIKYTMPRNFVFIVYHKFDFHSQNYLQNLLFEENKHLE